MGKGLIKKAGLKVAVLVMTVFLATTNMYASQQEITLFDQGYEHYLSYQPEKAIESFHSFLNQYPNSSMKDAALFWLGRSLLKLQSYEEATTVFLRLKQEIPDSPYMGYVNKELEMINAPDAENKTMIAIQKVNSEIQALMNDISQAKRALSDITEERNKLIVLLEEEKMKKKEMEAKADSFDRELRDILEKLQALRTNREDDRSTITISQVQNDEHDPVLQSVSSPVTETENGNDDTKETVQAVVTKQEKQAAPLQEDQKEHRVTRQETSHTLELIATEETWVFVTIDDTKSRERLLKPGARIKWSAKNGFSLRIGNAGGITLLFNGKDIGPLGEKGKVVNLKLPSVKISTTQKEPSGVL